MNEPWDKTLWLAKKIDDKSYDLANKIQSVLSALTTTTLQIIGTGAELEGTTVTVVSSTGESTFSAVFPASLIVTFSLTELSNYTITYVQNVNDSGQQVTTTKTVLVSDYGFYTVNVTYFPGYDMWDQWCVTGGVDPSTYGSLVDVLADATAVTILMNTTASEEYLLESGVNHDGEHDNLLTNVLNTTLAVVALVRSAYMLRRFKNTALLRSKFVNSSTAKKAAFETADVIKTTSASKRVSATSDAGAGCGASGSAGISLSDEKMLIIYGASSCSAWGWSYTGASAMVAVNGSTLFGVSRGRGGNLNENNSVNISWAGYVTYADYVTSAALTSTLESCGESSNNGTGTIYYI